MNDNNPIYEIKDKEECPHGIHPVSGCYICEEEKKQKELEKLNNKQDETE